MILLGERQSVHRRTDRCMDRVTHKRSKERCKAVKFQRILVYLGRYTINFTTFGPYTLNVRTNISLYGPHPRLVRSKF